MQIVSNRVNLYEMSKSIFLKNNKKSCHLLNLHVYLESGNG